MSAGIVTHGISLLTASVTRFTLRSSARLGGANTVRRILSRHTGGVTEGTKNVITHAHATMGSTWRPHRSGRADPDRRGPGGYHRRPGRDHPPACRDIGHRRARHQPVLARISPQLPSRRDAYQG